MLLSIRHQWGGIKNKRNDVEESYSNIVTWVYCTTSCGPCTMKRSTYNSQRLIRIDNGRHRRPTILIKIDSDGKISVLTSSCSKDRFSSREFPLYQPHWVTSVSNVHNQQRLTSINFVWVGLHAYQDYVRGLCKQDLPYPEVVVTPLQAVDAVVDKSGNVMNMWNTYP